MHGQRREYLLVLTLALVTTAPALGQTSAASSVPDFSGIWAHPALGFEPPLSGPGPVRNLSRLPSGTGNFALVVGDYSNPILKPHAAEIVKTFGEISRSGKAFPDPDNLCLQNPVPYIFWNFDIQLLQQKDKVTIIYQHDEDFRQIPLNQPHPAIIKPSVHGHSVGHYEGDTLVVDTVGVKVGKYRMIDRFGTPFTEALHVVERYRLVDYETAKEGQERGAKEWMRIENVDLDYRGKGLQLQFTVEDDGVFTVPWTATVSYLRARRTGWEERICAENVQHDYAGNYYSDPDARLPTANKPDF